MATGSVIVEDKSGCKIQVTFQTFINGTCKVPVMFKGDTGMPRLSICMNIILRMT